MPNCKVCKNTGFCQYEPVNRSGTDGKYDDFCYACEEGDIQKRRHLNPPIDSVIVYNYLEKRRMDREQRMATPT